MADAGGKIRLKQLSQDGAIDGQVVTYVVGGGPAGEDQWIPAASGGGGGGETLTFGGKLNNIGRYAAVNGPPGAATTSSLDETSEVSSPVDATSISFAWNSATADATTRLDLIVNGVFEANLDLDGISGVLSGVVVSIAAEALISVQYEGGQSPGDTNCQIVLGG